MTGPVPPPSAGEERAWANETLYPDWGQRFRIERELARVRSDYQDILVFESASHGRVMVLDGCVQITEADEFTYQEMIAHVPLIAHGAARRVLIVGAGDGGVLRRVLEHRGIEHAVMVEIDGEVIRLSREHLPGIAGSAWADPRAEVIVGDGIDYVARSAAGSFDVVIVDSTDPAGPGEVLFTDAFYADCHRILSEGGILVSQCGVPFVQGEELRDVTARQRRVFPTVTCFVAAVPTYVGGLMALGFAVRGTFPTLSAGEAAVRAEASGILGRTRYWSPEVHVASFALPPYIRDKLPTGP